jgi:hypothetical protein
MPTICRQAEQSATISQAHANASRNRRCANGRGVTLREGWFMIFRAELDY